jgi:hypothetical protein
VHTKALSERNPTIILDHSLSAAAVQCKLHCKLPPPIEWQYQFTCKQALMHTAMLLQRHLAVAPAGTSNQPACPPENNVHHAGKGQDKAPPASTHMHPYKLPGLLGVRGSSLAARLTTPNQRSCPCGHSSAASAVAPPRVD